ncbi:MAG: ATP-binding domain-containing protein, partial [Cyanobium sp.]
LARLAASCWPGLDQGWAELFAERDRLLVLSPIRRGRWGIDALHRTLLGPAALAPSLAIASLPGGTPLLCRRNLPELGLANGDIGVLVARSEVTGDQGGHQRLLFGQEEPLWFHPAQLAGALEPALVLTVHKAQGSEAMDVVVLLEDPHTAEPRLLYTALTRARERALVVTSVERT